MNRTIFSTFIAVIFLVACNSKVDDKLEQEMIRTLEQNNVMLDIAEEKIEEDFRKKLSEPETKEKAEIWFPKVQQANSLLKQLIKKMEDSKSSLKGENLNNLFSEYKSAIEKLDAKTKDDLSEVFTNKSLETKNTNVNIHLIKNKAIILRNIFNKWCLNQIGTVGWSCEFPTALTSQNATHFKPNEKLEIIAGIGVYSSRMNPQIFIGNKKINLQPEGYAKNKVNVGTKLGTFKKLVKISFKKPDGTIGTVEREIKYTVD